ncbi:MAG: hypothetical protein KKB59_19940 [Spirochaetes bacterium]|nr:hypothetical protein [Spirochaetota bacterium]
MFGSFDGDDVSYEAFIYENQLIEAEAKIRKAIKWIDEYDHRKGEEPCVPLYELYDILTDWNP